MFIEHCIKKHGERELTNIGWSGRFWSICFPKKKLKSKCTMSIALRWSSSDSSQLASHKILPGTKVIIQIALWKPFWGVVFRTSADESLANYGRILAQWSTREEVSRKWSLAFIIWLHTSKWLYSQYGILNMLNTVYILFDFLLFPQFFTSIYILLVFLCFTKISMPIWNKNWNNGKFNTSLTIITFDSVESTHRAFRSIFVQTKKC